MKKLVKVFFVLFFGLTMSASLLGQTTLQTVNFEADGSGYTVEPQEYSLANSDVLPDYWTRTDDDTEDIAPSNAFSNIQGTWFFAGEDLDNLANTYSVTCNSVSVSGYSNLQITLLVGARSGTGIEGEEYLRIQYNMDGAGYTTFMEYIWR